MSALERLSITELASAIGRQQISAVETTAYFLDRIERFDGELSGYVHVAHQAALVRAGELDRRIAAGEDVGPLGGVPISVKDIVDVADMPTTGASRSRLDRMARKNAPVVSRLLGAGAVVLGKANCHELAFGGPSFDLPFPPARNPWDPAMFPGGSSSGSGVTVAAGLCKGSVATDTAGSIRLPSTLCGMVGLKPTFGAVPVGGIDALSPSMDHCGPIAASVQDCRLLFAAMAGDARAIPSMPAEPTFSGIRLGVSATGWDLGDRLKPDMARAIGQALDLFEQNGGTIVELDLPPLETFHAPGSVIMMAEAAAQYGNEVRGNFSAFGEMFRGRALVGQSLLATDLVHALDLRARLTATIDQAFGRVDAIVMPGALASAGPLKAVDKFYFLQEPIPNILANLTGHPSLALPFGKTEGGVAVGVQLLGPKGGECGLLDLAQLFERLAPDPVRLAPRYAS